MSKSNKYRSFQYFIIPFGVLIAFVVLTQWTIIPQLFNGSRDSEKNSESVITNMIGQKQKGAHVFGIMDTTNLESISSNNIEWVTLVSWGFQDDIDSPIVTHHDRDSVYIAQHNEHWIKQIKFVRDAGFKVFFKPHLWVTYPSDGKWRSDISPSNDQNWESWMKTYRDFIMRYAKIAEASGAEMYCIGAEFSRLTIEKPLFWEDLIEEIRAIYSGKITYAANWYEEFEKIRFWDQLDYIGIQAYFPLAENNFASLEQVSNGWNIHLSKIESVYEKFDLPILFTELGYRSTANCAVKPWEWVEDTSKRDNPFSAETQANCYQAFFNVVWNKDWMAGVHIWQFRDDYLKHQDAFRMDFTPQGKLAERIIAKGFK